MQRQPNQRTLAAAFLVASASVSIAVLAVRNLYDDEISSLGLVTSPIGNILRATASGDVHPPGMYLLAHFAYHALPSFRWMDLLPCIFLYLGMAVFLLQVIPIFVCTRSRLCLLLLATLHPQLLMWSTTFRWYSWWTGLALITLTATLQLRISNPTFSTARALMAGLLLAGLFYLNYITFLFALALSAAMLLRYRLQPWKRLVPRALLTTGVLAALITPQLHTMIAVQLPNSRGQRSGLADSFLRLLQAVAASEAYLPWDLLAILAFVLFVALCVLGLIASLRVYRNRRSSGPPLRDSIQDNAAVTSIVLFGLLFFVFVALTGLGGKPRNGLLLIPVLAPAAGLVIDTLRPRAQKAILLFLVLWSTIGVSHLLGRYGLTKATMNDRPEQVVDFIRQAPDTGCSIVVTYDTELAFSLAQSNLSHMLVLSPFENPILSRTMSPPAGGCTHTRIYAVRSYLGEVNSGARALNDELQSSTQWIQGQPRTDSFSLDPDAARKRSLSRITWLSFDLASAAQLPDYRYVVTSGPIDPANLEAVRKSLPDFFGGS